MKLTTVLEPRQVLPRPFRRVEYACKKAEFVMRRVLGHREHDKPAPAGQVVVQVSCREEKGGVP